MNLLKLSPVILSFLMLAAHFYRSGLVIFAIISLLIPFLLFIRNIWIPRMIQIILIIGALEWIRTILIFVEERKLYEMPWVRLAVILGSVALFTALSGLLFQLKSIKRYYKN